jgi:predicted benzoate:H+ symporter BenE
MDQKRLVTIFSWVALIRFVPGFAVIAYAVRGLIDALIYGHAEFCVGPKYHTVCNTVTAAQYPELHWQIQMYWLSLAFGCALLLVGWFVPRSDNANAKNR